MSIPFEAWVDPNGGYMRRQKWRWKEKRILVESAIIGVTAALLVILFTESGVDRQRHSVGQGVECAGESC